MCRVGESLRFGRLHVCTTGDQFFEIGKRKGTPSLGPSADVTDVARDVSYPPVARRLVFAPERCTLEWENAQLHGQLQDAQRRITIPRGGLRRVQADAAR